MSSTSGELGGYYGYFELYDEINALGVNVVAIIPYGAQYVGEAGYPAIVSPYNWSNAYPTVKQWCGVGPRAGTYGAEFIVLYKAN